MSTIRPVEIVVYVHGVSPGLYSQSHAEDYHCMHRGVQKYNAEWPSSYLGIEWSWGDCACSLGDLESLADAQRLLGERLFPAINNDRDFTINPGRAIINNLRPLMFYGFGDMFYYVSADGKRAVRNAVVQQLCRYTELDVGPEEAVSITLIGHSAGTVISFDLAFFLFFAGDNAEYRYLPSNDPAYDDARHIRHMADDGRLRIRRLVTFGSPIAMMAFRSDAVVRILASGGLLNPVDYGLVQSLSGASELSGPRWLNIWDKDDPIAWPVQPLMHKDPDVISPVEDIYVDVSDSIGRSHSEYWRSERVFKAIAERW